ncbi:MAG TPA: MFS transporter [Bryobacteraceae bacterium]|nr:MFS transporter [Bryobacteraceae bacterium]
MSDPGTARIDAGAFAGLIAARLDRLPFTRSLWRLVALVSLGGAFDLYDIFLSTYIAPGLVASGLFQATTPGLFDSHGIGFFIFSTFAGMFVGSMGFGFIADHTGRRAIFLSSLVLYSAATAIMACQTTAAVIDLWRFLASVGIGVEQVTIDTFLAEFVPPRERGRAFAFSQFIWFSVIPVVALMGWLLVPRSPLGIAGWRWVTLAGSLGALAAWWMRRGIPESPRWLALHGRHREAEQAITAMEKMVARDLGAPLPAPGPPREAIVSGGGFSEILRPPYRGRTLVLSIFNLMQTIAFYGFGSWVPTLLIAKGVHITTSLEYAFLIAAANPVGPLAAMLIADRMERKWQLVWAGAAIGVCMLAFAHQTNPALVILFGAGVTLANCWMSTALHNYQGEIFPTRVRARAVGFVYAWSRLSAAFAGLSIGFFLRAGGTAGVALFIGAAMLIMMVTIGGFGPRTRRMALEEIAR